LVQAAMTILFIALAKVAGETAEQAYLILVNLGIIAYFIPYLYLFASLVVLQHEPLPEGAIGIPGGRKGAYFAGIAGLAVTALSIILSCIPGAEVTNKQSFFGTVFGTVIVTLLVGVAIYWHGKRQKDRVLQEQ
jgi:glutamate:GABA antiporter